MSEKMREGFEVWACNYNLKIADWGNYADRHVNNMWKAWQASSAAMVAELPANCKGMALTVDELRAMLGEIGATLK